MRRLAVVGLLALLLAVPAASAKGLCPADAPCRIDVTAAPGSLTVEPGRSEGLGSYRFFVRNAGDAPLNVTIDGQLVVPVGGNQTNASLVLTFFDSAELVLREDAGGATATLSIVATGRQPGEWGKSATVMSVALPCLVGVALVGIAILVLRNGAVHRHNLVFGAYYLLSGLKSFSEGVDGVAQGFHANAPLFPPEGFWTLLAAFCALAMLPTLLLFLASFPRPLEALQRRPALGAVVFLPSALVAVLLVGGLLGVASAQAQATASGAFNVYGTLLTVLVLVHVLRATHSPERIERTQARYVALGFFPAFLMGWIITLLQIAPGYGLVDAATASVWVQDLIHFVSPLLELLSAGAVAFAILRYNILGVSPRFRIGVKSFLVGFIFVVVFLMTQFVENVVLQGKLFSFAGEYGSFMLSGIAGIVLFKPIERVSEKAADRLVPDRKGDDAAQRAAEVYRAQCTYVLRDAQVTEREMAFLRNLRGQLGLSEAVARGIEESVERTLKVDAPQTGASAGTAPEFIAAAAADLGVGAEVRRASAPASGNHPPPVPVPPMRSAAPKGSASSPGGSGPKPKRAAKASAKAAKPAAGKASPKAPGKPATKPASKAAGKAKAGTKPPGARQSR